MFCAASEGLLRRWQSSIAKFLCRGRIFIFWDLEWCPAKVYCPAKVWQLSSRGRRPRLDIQTKAGSQTKEMKVPLKAWKVGLKVFNSWKHSNDALGILFFWGRGLDLRLDLDLSLWSELQHFKNSLKVSRSSTENSRPEACYFPKSEARGQNWPLRLPSYTTSIKNH